MSTKEANSSPTGDPTIRSNVFNILDTTKTITGISPNGQWMVSAGQPSNPPPTVTPNHSDAGYAYTIEFDAGRQATSPVADQFNTLSGGMSHEWCLESFDSSPSELNFYFGLIFTLEAGGASSQVTVYLAQGSNAFSNNWWIGGGSISNPGVLSATVGGENVGLLIQNYIYDTDGFTFVSASDSVPQH